MIPYGRHSVSQADIDAVVEVLRSDRLTQGPAVARFERALAAYCGAEGAVAVSSGTAALHLACRALGFGPGDVLWTSPITFVSSANCALLCGGEVDFVDIDPRTYNLCPDALADRLAAAERAGRLPRVVVPVHYAGQPCDMARIGELAQQYGFRVVEDAAHALGAGCDGGRVGDCRFADITVFSLHPVKLVTTGEGGVLLSNDADLRRRLVELRSHGITRAADRLQAADPGGWYYEQQALGFNYRMTDIQAALGASQLQRVAAFLDRRRALAMRYARLLEGLPLRLPWEDPRHVSAWHLYPVVLDGGGPVRRAVYDRMHAAGVAVQVHYIPVHTQPFYRARGFRAGDFPRAEAFYDGVLSLPLYPDLSDAEQDRVVELLRDALEVVHGIPG